MSNSNLFVTISTYFSDLGRRQGGAGSNIGSSTHMLCGTANDFLGSDIDDLIGLGGIGDAIQQNGYDSFTQRIFVDIKGG